MHIHRIARRVDVGVSLGICRYRLDDESLLQSVVLTRCARGSPDRTPVEIEQVNLYLLLEVRMNIAD